MFIGRTDAEAETPILWPPDAKTLPTKVHLIKAMVFPVIMYGCESWTIKKTWKLQVFGWEKRWKKVLIVET